MRLNCDKFLFSAHALKVMFERNIQAGDVLDTIKNGTLIKEYENDKNVEKKYNQNEEFSELERKMSEIDADSLSPVEALMKIYELKKIAENEKKSIKIAKLRKAMG